MKKFNDRDDLQKTFPQLEREIIEYWKKNNIFEKSIQLRDEKNIYSFYDGPPFITGLPHYGSLLPSIAKDVIPRFQTMKGKRVRRVWGWDCHGLPAENKVEDKLGIKGKRDIEKLGIGKFIDECKTYVKDVSSEWNWYIDHIGRWVDFENAYKTMDLSYMESVLWVFKQMYENDLIYKGTRVSLFCPRCSTPISNFEIAMDNSYKDMEDTAITIKFKLKNKNTHVLAWTTTPWTLPANQALAVNPTEEYSEILVDGVQYILASALVDTVFAGKEIQVQSVFKGEELIGEAYEPLYTFFQAGPNDYKIYGADFVSMQEGTGVVHIAPGFGEDDTNLGREANLSMNIHVDDEGKLIDAITPWKELFFKDANQPIIEELQGRGMLLKVETITHSYPVCYRCETPLLFRAQEAWYIAISKIKSEMLSLNEAINWVPEHIKHGRFQKGLESAPDWCISRSRYWGTPIPIWECNTCKERYVIGSLKELKELSGKDVKDLHRPGIDEVQIKCQKCGGIATRVPEVLDCWFESGSMPFAQLHYPFENTEYFEKSFPADFIVEYIAQVRGWFYTLHVISTALTKSNAFKNVVVTGVIMGSDGRKMSKLFKNYPDPKLTIEKYGGDALRLLLMGSPLMLGEDFNINEKDIANQVKNVLLPLWNSYKYFLTYANMYGLEQTNTPSTDTMDRWIILKLHQLISDISINLERYTVPQAVKTIQPFLEDLSTWYIRRSRKRFASGDQNALNTLYTVLLEFSKACAPIIPFVTEAIFLNLHEQTRQEADQSVHLQDYPVIPQVSATQNKHDQMLVTNMQLLREAATLGQALRIENKLKIRQPLQKITLSTKFSSLSTQEELLRILSDELNIKEIGFAEMDQDAILDTSMNHELIIEGITREVVRAVQAMRKTQGYHIEDTIKVSWKTDSPDISSALNTMIDAIKKDIKAHEITENINIGEEYPLVVNGEKVFFTIEKI